MRHYKQSDTYFCRSMDTKMERVMNKNKVPRKRGEVLIHSFKQSDTYFCRSMDTKMEKVMNNNKVPKKSGEVITRVKLPGDCDIFNEFVEDDSMEFSVCLFKADTCFIIPQDDALRHKLLHFRPDKQKKYPQFTGSKYSSFIVYRNTLGKLVTIGNVPECKQMFTELEERISYSHRREADYFDLINASKKASGSRSPPIIQANSEFIGRNRDSQRNGIMAYISTSFINHDKVVPPGPIEDNEKIVKPADKNTYENPPYPAQESTHGFGEQAVSGFYTRNELFRPDITHEESGFHRYNPSLYSGLQSSSHRPTRSTPAPAFPEYRNYATRKATFRRWNRVYPSESDFTDAGFFLTDEDDLVRCFQCGIGLREITTETIPLVEHAKYSRDCPFLKESLGTEELNQLQVQSQNAPREPTYPGRSLQSFSRYRHPEYRLYTTRLATFDNWPSALGQQPEQLAQAGLYYTGIDDLVRCFSCDGGLRRWEPDDNPWIEHCRWFPTCPFAIEVKGEDFINMVLSASAEMDGAFGVDDEQASSQPTHLLTKQSPTVTAILNEHRATVVKMMGFDEDEFVEAVLELKRRDANTTVEDILEVIEINKDRKVKEEELKTLKEENPYELNRRLKNFLVCCVCNKNEANALFLPCCHHNTCVTCAEVMTKCPKCTRPIQQTIKTYLG